MVEKSDGTTLFGPRPGRGNFMAHWAPPDFGIWALGYTHAAQSLRRSLLARINFADFDAYPLVFLYRHALELALKNAIVKALDLSALHGDDLAVDRLRLTHRLPELLSLAQRLLKLRFPQNQFLENLFARLHPVVAELHEIDPDSTSFRYPMNRHGRLPSDPLTLSVRALSGSLDPLLDDLDTIDCGMTAEIDVAQEAWQLLYEATL